MAQSPRKNLPGSRPVLRSYPKNQKARDPALMRTLAQEPNAALINISEDTEGEAPPTWGELIFGRIKKAALLQEAESGSAASASGSGVAFRGNDGSGPARMPDPGHEQKPGTVARMLDPDIAWRGSILPLGMTREGERTWALPEAVVSTLRALTLLGDAISEGYQPSPGELTDLALLLTGAGPLTNSSKASALASRNVRMYDPPSKPVRPFDKDYPAGARTDEFGNLTHDIEGRPLQLGGRIVGRSVYGGGDTGLPPAEYDAVTKAATGQGPSYRPPSHPEIGRDLGRTLLRPVTRHPKNVVLADNLTPQQVQKVYGHEIGHVIDQLAGEIPAKGLTAELRSLYNTLNNPNRTGAEVPREFMAEAIRAYMADPNHIKTVAPKTAAAIRAAVNADPEVSRIIQFNMGGSPLAAALAGTTGPAKPQPEVDWEKLYRSGGAI